eukprot:3104529-Prymnesium_polylepis.1
MPHGPALSYARSGPLLRTAPPGPRECATCSARRRTFPRPLSLARALSRARALTRAPPPPGPPPAQGLRVRAGKHPRRRRVRAQVAPGGAQGAPQQGVRGLRGRRQGPRVAQHHVGAQARGAGRL